MLAMQAKRGIESATQKVFQASGRSFSKFEMLWHGSTAKVKYDGDNALIVLPALDETKDVSKKLFNDLIGYVIHELGHVWFTDNKPWDDTARKHGKYVGTLINGLEDPRIERKVIDSGYAPNSFDLFNTLINNVVVKSGYPPELTQQSLPFVLTVEGRRLNGYHIDVPDLITGSPFESDIRWALNEAHIAPNTARIAEIAVELYRRLFPDDEIPEDDGGEDGDEDGTEEGTEDGTEDGTEEGAEKGDKGKKGTEDDAEGTSDPKDGKPSDKPSDRLKDDGTECRDPEVNDYINTESKPLKCGADDRVGRPVLKSQRIVEFNFI